MSLVHQDRERGFIYLDAPQPGSDLLGHFLLGVLVLEVDLDKGQVQVAAEVSDGLRLAPYFEVDQHQWFGLLLLHILIKYLYIYIFWPTKFELSKLHQIK